MKIFIVLISLFAVIVTADNYENQNSNGYEDPAAASSVEYYSENSDHQSLSAEPEPKSESVEGHLGNNDKILKQDNQVNNKGFKYNFETSNGIYTDGSGILKEFGKGYRDRSKGLRRDNGIYHGQSYRHDETHTAVVVDGAFGWVDKKSGAKFDIKYVADELGYQPAPIKLPKH